MKLQLAGVVFTVLLALSSLARAQNNPNVNMDDFVPSVHAWDNLGVSSTRIDKGVTPSAGMWLTYRKNALSMQGAAGGAQVLSDQLVADFTGAISLFGWASIGLDIPVFFMSNGDDPTALGANLVQADGASLGDIRLSAKVKFWDNGNKGVGLGLVQDLSLPTATGDNFTGEDTVASRTNLVLDYNKNGWSAALNLGYFARSDAEEFLPAIGDELLIGAGLVIPILCDDLEVLLTSNTRTYASDPFAGENYTAVNFLAGLKVRPLDGLVLTAAGGSGYGTMPGNPEWQAMLNIGFERKPQSCDLDGDGVCDRKDECRDVPGPADNAGCPDQDRDGVLDAQDRCPTVHGKKHLEGCPDRDDDDIADFKDQCPDVKGLAQFAGCPDSDEDGIPDDGDNCPKVKGLAKFKGCPDRDGDGVQDSMDKCPDLPGAPKTAGCPDKDSDGIFDAEDKCPDVWGTAKYAGCPPPTPKKVQITAKKIVILDKVFFATGKSRIMSKSYSLLRDVATVLKDNPWVKKVQIEGHTDDVGKKDFNLKLSQDRADAVMKFLIKQGVEADRLESVGYGPDKPLVDEKTKDARAQNRRVEFSIIDPK